SQSDRQYGWQLRLPGLWHSPRYHRDWGGNAHGHASIDGAIMGVSIDTGPKIDPDLQVIYQGGANFISRMEALQKAKADAEAALAALNLGRDAKGAHEEAEARMGAAKEVMLGARRTADEARAAAKKQIDASLDAANARL